MLGVAFCLRVERALELLSLPYSKLTKMLTVDIHSLCDLTSQLRDDPFICKSLQVDSQNCVRGGNPVSAGVAA